VPQRMKCYWVVTAGVLLNVPMPEYTKRWEWTPTKVENGRVEMTPDQLLEFHAIVNSSLEYARELQNPGFVNWVRMEWIWV
jgi:hypothetical protein